MIQTSEVIVFLKQKQLSLQFGCGEMCDTGGTPYEGFGFQFYKRWAQNPIHLLQAAGEVLRAAFSEEAHPFQRQSTWYRLEGKEEIHNFWVLS